MPTVILHRAQDGKLEGLSERDKKAFAKFRKRLDELGDGSLLFSWQEPRSGPYHRRFFSLVNRILMAQDQFQDIEHLIAWLKTGAGYVDLVPGPKGKPVALPKSINWATLDQADFIGRGAPATAGLLVSNPPYGVRLSEQEALQAEYPEWGRTLKQQFSGWTAALFTADLELPKGIGLKPRRRFPLKNGALECRLFVIDPVSGFHRKPKPGANSDANAAASTD